MRLILVIMLVTFMTACTDDQAEDLLLHQPIDTNNVENVYVNGVDSLESYASVIDAFNNYQAENVSESNDAISETSEFTVIELKSGAEIFMIKDNDSTYIKRNDTNEGGPLITYKLLDNESELERVIVEQIQ
ncbi:hypothetical protein ACTWQB_10270 [Piscibacillus sp. B03]|uniref:hypothetical protein n=1 Tax=Piscibacillus sp. B03 TaxID=3457430 RepID=UPI003FCC53CA